MREKGKRKKEIQTSAVGYPTYAHADGLKKKSEKKKEMAPTSINHILAPRHTLSRNRHKPFVSPIIHTHTPPLPNLHSTITDENNESKEKKSD